MICQDYTISPTDCDCIFIFDYLEVMFPCVVVTKGDQFDHPIGQEHSAVKSLFIIEIT